jgi:hypothetical protein
MKNLFLIIVFATISGFFFVQGLQPGIKHSTQSIFYLFGFVALGLAIIFFIDDLVNKFR